MKNAKFFLLSDMFASSSCEGSVVCFPKASLANKYHFLPKWLNYLVFPDTKHLQTASQTFVVETTALNQWLETVSLLVCHMDINRSCA